MGELRQSSDVPVAYPAMATESRVLPGHPMEEALHEARAAAGVVKMLLDYPADETVWTQDFLYAILVEELGKLNRAVRDCGWSLAMHMRLRQD